MTTEPSLAISARTDTGRVRSHNEDAIFVDAVKRFAILADGMGGYQAGEVASALAVDTIRNCLVAGLDNPANLLLPVLLDEAVRQANTAILDTAAEDPACQGMGTTVVVSAFRDDTVAIAHVGDSRAYRLRDGVFVRLTRDHSVLQDHIDAGLITPEEARHSPIRNLVTRAVGSSPEIDVEIHEHRIEPDDLYVLCSDGLTDMLDDPEIERILKSQAARLDAACALLVDEANANGGVDNISVVLIRVGVSVVQEGLLHRLRNWVKPSA